MPGAPLERLDSWKQIADYLGRDVRTAMRWSKMHGLPVRRVGGGRSRSVFAYRSELDGWLTGIGAGLSEAPGQPVSAEPADPEPVLAATPASVVTRTRLWPLRAWMIAAAVIIIGASGALTAGFSPRAAAAPVGAKLNPSGVVIRDAKGAERLVWPFDRSGEAVMGTEARAELLDLDGDGTSEIVASVPFYRAAQRAVLGGELIALHANGGTRWRFSRGDQLRIGGRLYDPPWVVSAWSASPAHGARRIAVASHHFEWWPSVVNLLDQSGRPTGTFVNAGWINAVQWIGKDRLAITGVNNAQNGGMFALIDAEDVNGHSPDTAEGFLCEACPAGAPVFYVTFARSELNLVTGATFNKAVVDVTADRFVVQTMEIEPAPGLSGESAIYEFTRDLRLVSARYSDRYWDLHRRLEYEGKIGHTRENCSQRDGPGPVSVWTSASGWTSVSPR